MILKLMVIVCLCWTNEIQANANFMFIRMLQLETFPNGVYPDPIHKGTHQVSWQKGGD